MSNDRDVESASQWCDHDVAIEEYRFWKEHGRPPKPFYIKCTNCGDINEVNGHLYDADHDARRHAGVHTGLHDEDAELIVIDAYGKEVFRLHGFFKPEHGPDGCEFCGEVYDESKRATCPSCGGIATEAQL